MLAVRFLNSLDIAGRVRGLDKVIDAGISAVAIGLGESRNRADLAYQHVEEIVRRAGGNITEKTETLEGTIPILVRTASVKGILSMDLSLVRREQRQAYKRWRPLQDSIRPKKKREPRYSFLASRGESKL